MTTSPLHALPPLPATTLSVARRFIAVGDVLDVMSAEDGAFHGRFVSSDEAWFVIRLASGIEAEIPVEDIRRINRVTGRGMEGALFGALAGGIPLAILSWMLGAGIHSGPEYYFLIFALGAIPVIGGLALIGWGIGFVMRRCEPILIGAAIP